MAISFPGTTASARQRKGLPNAISGPTWTPTALPTSSAPHSQMRKKQGPLAPNLISSLPQPTEPNQQVHANLFRPLKTSANGKKVTDAFTKYIKFVALPNKEAASLLCHLQ
jgi:hypothetical protein